MMIEAGEYQVRDERYFKEFQGTEKLLASTLRGILMG